MKRAGLLLLPLAALLLVAAKKSEPVLPPEQESEHVVQPGETLGGIAARAKVPRVLIAEANGLQPPYAVRTGQKLMIPRTRHHSVKRGETGFTIAYTYAIPWRDIAVANGMEPDGAIRPGQRLLIPTIITRPVAQPAGGTASTPVVAPTLDFAWPLAGPVRRGYTARPARDYHDGIDIRSPAGTAVRSVAAGKVLFAGNEPTQFGNMVVVDHGDGWHSAYAFLSRLTVKEGDDVSKGERIGLVGRTGLAKGDELHFELRRNNRPVDPASRLPAR
jgi:murein DD-endopeptidase MepM/ murein hydrolase activator NlpD